MAENQEPGSSDDALRALAAQADAEGWSGEDTVESAESTPAQEQAKPEAPKEQEGTTEVTPSQEQSQPTEPAVETSATKEIDFQAEYERLKKEQDRKERSWQRLNEEKDALAKLKATTRPNETRISGDQFSAEEYEAYAEKVIEEGGPDAVKVARQAMTRAKQIQQEAFKDRWQRSINEAIEEDPELGNQESGLAKAVRGLLADPNWANFKSAVKIAKSQQLADSIPGLKGEIETYKKEIERLNKAMEVGGKPGTHKRDAPKSFEAMLQSGSLDEAQAHLRRRAEEADENAY